jgi:hypothetical protein
LAAGTYPVTATYPGDPNVASAQATGTTLTKSAATAPLTITITDLPNTGVPAAPIIGVGLLSLITGLGLLESTRRTKKRLSASAASS